jgi:hypothetical protein
MIGVLFLRGLSFPITAFSSAPSPLVVLWIILWPFLLFDGYGLGIAQERDPEEGRTVTNLGRSPLGRKTVTIFS